MTGTECFHAALSLLTETSDSGAYYEQFALSSLNQLLAGCLREMNAERTAAGEAAFSAPPRLAALSAEIPASEWLARECLPYGLAALLVLDDDKDKFNWASAEFAQRLLAHCPAELTAVQEMI